MLRGFNALGRGLALHVWKDVIPFPDGQCRADAADLRPVALATRGIPHGVRVDVTMKYLDTPRFQIGIAY
ncbi:MAG: hypothetical protein HIU89_15575 [Proteobacteria bacterium]|nr:hypothetical protein [Pseudomonadota bacterium]